jgi:hypothetical protein
MQLRLSHSLALSLFFFSCSLSLSLFLDGFFELTTMPKKVVVVGAGYIGVELAGVFNGLGAHTTLVSRNDGVLKAFDPLIRTVGSGERVVCDTVNSRRAAYTPISRTICNSSFLSCFRH